MRFNRLYKPNTFSAIMESRCRLRNEKSDRLALEALIAETLHADTVVGVSNPNAEDVDKEREGLMQD